jgi:hypothetical protein
MRDEAIAASELGINWTVLLVRADPARRQSGRWGKAVRYLLLRARFYFRVVRLSRAGQVIVLRHSVGDPLQYVAALLMRPYYTVHHTMEEGELAALNLPWSRVQLTFERTLGRRTVARAKGLICVTGEIAEHQKARCRLGDSKPVFIYPNGVRLNLDLQKLRDERGSRPELLFVAGNFFPWHGLETLIESLTGSSEDGILHLVGRIPRDLDGRLQNFSRVRVHGHLEPNELRPLYQRAWLGLSSFNLANKRMHEACTLKVREYLSWGLPAYAGHRDAGLPDHFAYFRQGPADWANILATAREFRSASREMVVEQARQYIDKSMLLTRLHASLTAVHDRGRLGATVGR